MSTVLLLIHVMIAIALVGVVLLQRSEGGALGIGGGGGGFMTGRSAGNALTKTTAILAACFFATSLALSILAGTHRGTPSIIPGGDDGGGLAPLQMPSPAAPTAPSAPPAPAAPQSE
ncbi:MAG: preprotein translocase subunit SecG [Methyloceanibacter sp.]